MFNRNSSAGTAAKKRSKWSLFRTSAPAIGNTNVSGSLSGYDAHEQLLIEKVIELLKTSPDNFSARWFGSRTSLDRSVQSKDKNILIMIESGEIIKPVYPKMSDKQMEEIKQLIAPIVKKDSDYLIEKLVCNCR